MARQNIYGRFIISAGEVGSYTVCPEAWRRKRIQKVKRSDSESMTTGEQLHRAWAEGFDEAVYLSRAMRLVLLLIALSIVLYALS